MKAKNLTGMKFNRWTVIAPAGVAYNRQSLWKCRCECGNEGVIVGASLKAGTSKSCGCLQSEIASKGLRERRTTHGMARTGKRTLVWSSWSMALQRCYNPKRPDFHNYGGRGIKACEFFKSTPKSVIELIGDRTSTAQTLDRIDNDGGYTCGKCSECLNNGWKLNIRWASKFEQARNKRNNVWIQVGNNRVLYTDLIRQNGRRKVDNLLGA